MFVMRWHSSGTRLSQKAGQRGNLWVRLELVEAQTLLSPRCYEHKMQGEHCCNTNACLGRAKCHLHNSGNRLGQTHLWTSDLALSYTVEPVYDGH